MNAPTHVRAPKALNTSLPQHESLVHMFAAAVDAHMGSAAIGAALAELGPLLAGPPAIERFVQRA